MKEVKRMTLKQAGREDERMSCADRQLAKEGGRKRRTGRMAAAAQEEMRKGYMISTAAKQPVLSCPVLSSVAVFVYYSGGGRVCEDQVRLQ